VRDGSLTGLASVAHCPGQGQAEPGFLCVYVDGRSERGFSVSGVTNASTSFAGIVGTWTYAEGS
jgi:hypothetical protein